MKEFFKKAFKDMKENTKRQHEVDKANFEAVKAESRVNFEEAKLSSSKIQEQMQKEQQRQLEDAKIRREVAENKLEDLRK